MVDTYASGQDRLGVNPSRVQFAGELIESWARNEHVIASGFVIGRHNGMTEVRLAGRRSTEAGAALLRRDALFLAASLTKPVVAVALMMLLERGMISLDDPVAEHLPAFAQNGKERVRVRHLLTHTSGLPDMLPNNEELRARHEPIETFLAETNQTPLLFEPGTAVLYQSMGFLVLGEIISKHANRPVAEFLEREIFQPLGMASTSLGLNPHRQERQTKVRLSAEQRATDWHWNTTYWLALGAPWGGLVTSPTDYGRFMQMMLGGGRLGATRVLSPASVRAMTINQLAPMPGVPEEEKRLRPWGLGWRLTWPGTSAHFGDLLGPRTFGHWGSTGTLAWADPDRDAFVVILTSEPQGDHGRYLARLSNVLSAAFN